LFSHEIDIGQVGSLPFEPTKSLLSAKTLLVLWNWEGLGTISIFRRWLDWWDMFPVFVGTRAIHSKAAADVLAMTVRGQILWYPNKINSLL